jgi:carboxymethylenebutenolidase
MAPDRIVFKTTALLLTFCLISAACSSQGNRNDTHSSDIRVITRPIFYPQSKGPSPAVLVLPSAGSSISAHADSISRRLSNEGYIARAISYGQRTSGKILEDPNRLDDIKRLVVEGLTNLKIQPGVDATRIGIVAYSLGGLFAVHLASHSEESKIRAVVIYYGIYPVPELFEGIRAPVLAFQGESDAYRAFIEQAYAMQRVAQENHRLFELVMYPAAKHGFDYDASPTFDPSAAADAWKRTVAFLDKHLK